MELGVNSFSEQIIANFPASRMPPIEQGSIRPQGVESSINPAYGQPDCAVKRGIDLTGATLVLIFLLPVLLAIAVAIRFESRGSILFRQRRLGLGGRSFEVLKFRTMACDAEQRLAELEAENESPDGVLFQVRNDPRITRVGRFLRRTSLDELPQLVNVLRGEMSLVGPRPLQLRDCRRMADLDPLLFARRLSVLPGLTGLAQVSGRRSLIPRRILELDRDYVDNWSPAGDLVILCRTMGIVLSGWGAL